MLQKEHKFVIHPNKFLHHHTLRKKGIISKFNDKFAIWISTHVGNMYCFYLFNVLALLSAKAAFITHNPTIIINWVSSNWIQLVLLPAIMVAQNLAQKAADIIQAQQQAKAEADHQTLTYLANSNDEQLKILKELKSVISPE